MKEERKGKNSNEKERRKILIANGIEAKQRIEKEEEREEKSNNIESRIRMRGEMI